MDKWINVFPCIVFFVVRMSVCGRRHLRASVLSLPSYTGGRIEVSCLHILAPDSVLVLFSDSKARNTEVVRDVVDDERAEADVEEQGYDQCGPDEVRRVFEGGLNYWGSKEGAHTAVAKHPGFKKKHTVQVYAADLHREHQANSKSISSPSKGRAHS